MIKKTHLHSVFKSSLLVLFLGIMFHNSAKAQESINSSGNDIAGSGGAIVYSVGQVVFNTNSGSSGSVSEGVQQTYLISNIGVEETALNISLSAFPNPTTDYLTLQINEYNNEILIYKLYDIHGKELSNGKVQASQTFIDMNIFPPATYFINVINQENLPADRQGKKIQSFQIIKQ
jgi:hypothetical protein